MAKKLQPKGSLIAALDIGSSKIACFIAKVKDDNGNIDLIGIGHQASQGIRSGTIIDLDAAESSIRQAVHAAEHMAAEVTRGYPLREVIINVPAVHTQSHLMRVDVQVLGEAVTDNDIRRALAKAQDQAVQQNNSTPVELIHTIPTAFRIDGHEGIKEPRGLYGQMLEVDVHLVTGNMGGLRNIASCIESSHLDITALCSSPYAAGLAALVDDEMDLGCTVIDMGGGTTSIAVFQGRELIYADALPIGGQHVTSDIAKGLTTSIAAAERLKTLYGGAIATMTDDKDLIDVPQLGEDEHTLPNHVPRSYLVSIIQPRIEETFEMVRARLNDVGLSHVAGRRVVLTGGASQISGQRELAQMVLDKQVRLGRPMRLQGLPDAVAGPAFATTAGLMHYVTERTEEMPAEIMSNVDAGSLFQRAKMWLKENW
ncbi:MAG: cell division protein FtsA [Micavibrio aeruginosavorus]|uniref:Cell division protein FtsA n=1 Tax=Micavibrio aeruginosavorus TaxID=349221 RepID=A0A2W5FQQ8_9BACT|nr:MAG: cell division protein FtsA [Micavibrio aeruginosavorus]